MIRLCLIKTLERAATDLLNAVDIQLESDHPLDKYICPWEQLTELRRSLIKEKQNEND